MLTCRKCNQAIPTKRAHSKGCDAVVTKPYKQRAVDIIPPTEDKLDKITNLLGSVIEKQQVIEKRLDRIEQPGFKGPEELPKDKVVKTLETTLEIAKTAEAQGNIQQPKCEYGIHFPSDFGQEPKFNDRGQPIPNSLSIAKKHCFPATGAIRKLVDEILTPEFGADVFPDPFSATFQFSIIVPPKYCTIDDYRNGTIKDVRAKVINNYAAEPEIRAWCQKVKEKIYREHMAVQLPSPFTVPSLKQEMGNPAGNPALDYTIKQVV